MSIKGLDFACNQIGKSMKASKLRYIWKLELNGVLHQIEFYDSKLSGKKRLFRDGILIIKKSK